MHNELPLVTAVIGCEGEVHRGDRAKVGWALAELCDRVVLTTNNPRSELAMQIVEDILEGIRARAGQCLPGELMPAGLCPIKEVHVVADRADAVKLAVTLSIARPEATGKPPGVPNVAVVFGNSFRDVQEAPDASGEVRQWLFNDRRILVEALEFADKLADSEGVFDVSAVPWLPKDKLQKRHYSRNKPKISLSLPGQSLHWTYARQVMSDHTVTSPL
jgi:hypothetical protein